MRVVEVYRQVVIVLARACIAASRITDISDTRDNTEAKQIANEAVDQIEAAIKHGRKDLPA